MLRRQEKNFHVVTILEHVPSEDPAEATTDLKLLLRSGSVFWVTVPERFDPKRFLRMAVIEEVDGRPASIDFHPRDVRSKPATVICRIIAHHQE